MHQLSDCLRLQSHRNIRTAPLGDGKYDWKALIDSNTPPEDFPNLDKIADKHINDFWTPYGMNIPFTIEHKINNIFLKAAFIMKAHYAFLIFDTNTRKFNKKHFKIRGVSEISTILP